MIGKKKRKNNSSISKKQLTLFGFFTLTASMLMSADEYPAFAESGLMAVVFLVVAALIWFLPVALCSAEMATIDGWEEGGVFTWVKNALGERAGFIAVAMQWMQNTINFVTMLYFIIGAISFAVNVPILNENPAIKYVLFLIIFWTLTLSQLGGISKTDIIVKICFIFGIIIPSIIFLILAFTYILQGNPPQIDLSSSAISFDKFSISSFVPFILAFAGIEASASYANQMENPKRSYPLAILLLVLFAVVLDALGGLAVGIVVPTSELSMNSGVLQAIQIAIKEIAPALSWCTRFIAILLAMGMIGEVSSWVVGPVRTLFAAAQDQLLPAYFAKGNKNNVPVRLVILQGVVVSVIGAILTLAFGGNNSAFKISMSLTVMMYMVTYMFIFIAYLSILFKGSKLKRTFQIPGGKGVKTMIGFIGLISTILVFVATFIPSSEVQKVMSQELYIILMLVMFLLVLGGVLALYQKEEDRIKGVKLLTHHHAKLSEVNPYIFPKGRSSKVFNVNKDNEGK